MQALAIPSWLPALAPSGILLAIGFGAGGILSLALWRRTERSAVTGLFLLAGGAPLSLLGAKLLYLAQTGRWREPVSAAGYSLYGALLAVLGFWLLVRWFRPFALRQFLDCVTPGAALGLVFARVGCFLNGCCGGKPSVLPWAVRFPPGTPVHTDQFRRGLASLGEWSLPAHPTQLYEATFGLLCLAILVHQWSRKAIPGTVFLFGATSYACFRFGLELIRIPSGERELVGGLSPTQLLSLLLVLTGLIGLRWLGSRKAISLTGTAPALLQSARSEPGNDPAGGTTA